MSTPDGILAGMGTNGEGKSRSYQLLSRESEKLFVAVRLAALSDWDRQVIYGVRRFAHDRPGWRVYVETGDLATSSIVSGDVPIDGLITSTASHPVTSWQRFLRRTSAKVVSISFMAANTTSYLPQVMIDDAKIASAIGRHLLSGGFRQLAYFGHRRRGFEDARLNAFLAFAASEGIPCHTCPVSWKDKTEAPVAKVAKWIARLPKPAGVVTWNLKVGRTILAACVKARVNVPEQVALVAWDDDPLLAETLEPTISAAVLPAERLGFESARLLDQLLRGAPPPKKPLIIEPTGLLHVRQSSDVSTLANRDVYLAIQHIREHSAEALKVGEIAAALRISRSKLEREFLRVTGHTPHDAITQARLEHAKQLIVETDWSLIRIADRCGSGTQETLRRLFLKHEGMTPGAYRERFSGTRSNS